MINEGSKTFQIVCDCLHLIRLYHLPIILHRQATNSSSIWMDLRCCFDVSFDCTWCFAHRTHCENRTHTHIANSITNYDSCHHIDGYTVQISKHLVYFIPELSFMELSSVAIPPVSTITPFHFYQIEHQGGEILLPFISKFSTITYLWKVRNLVR